MKKKFNFYCIAMLAAILITFCLHISEFAKGVAAGYSDTEGTKTEAAVPSVMDDPDHQTYTVMLRHKNGITMVCDSIVNTKTGQVEHYAMEQAWIVSNTQSTDVPAWLSTVTLLVKLIAILLALAACWMFIKIVLNVNRGLIFEEHMERYLARSGWLFIAAFALRWITAYCDYLSASSVFTFEHYDVILNQPRSWTLYCGIGLLLIGQIFAIGRKMKEEQELTI